MLHCADAASEKFQSIFHYFCTNFKLKTMTDIIAIGKDRRTRPLVSELLEIWEASVRASHHFLTEDDILGLAPQAEGTMRNIETLWVLYDNRRAAGFMGVQNRKIEMLFLHPDYFRKGLGKMLVKRAFRNLDVEYVAVASVMLPSALLSVLPMLQAPCLCVLRPCRPLQNGNLSSQPARRLKVYVPVCRG